MGVGTYPLDRPQGACSGVHNSEAYKAPSMGVSRETCRWQNCREWQDGCLGCCGVSLSWIGFDTLILEVVVLSAGLNVQRLRIVVVFFEKLQ
jgi:hypothetical protein